jgi:hypothetical protein
MTVRSHETEAQPSVSENGARVSMIAESQTQPAQWLPIICLTNARKSQFVVQVVNSLGLSRVYLAFIWKAVSISQNLPCRIWIADRSGNWNRILAFVDYLLTSHPSCQIRLFVSQYPVGSYLCGQSHGEHSDSKRECFKIRSSVRCSDAKQPFDSGAKAT